MENIRETISRIAIGVFTLAVISALPVMLGAATATVGNTQAIIVGGR